MASVPIKNTAWLLLIRIIRQARIIESAIK
jgi:hypothetical protein